MPPFSKKWNSYILYSFQYFIKKMKMSEGGKEI